jgi:hypothetical protein
MTRSFLKFTGQGNDRGGQSATAGIQDPLLRIAEAGKIGDAKLRQRALGDVKAYVPLGCRGAQRRTTLAGDRRGKRATRIAQERFSRPRLACDPIGGQKRFRLTRRKQVKRDSIRQSDLFRLAEGRAQGKSDRQGDLASIQAGLKLGRQPTKECQAALDPELAAAQELSDGGYRKPVFVGQRRHDASLVHRADGLSPRVGFEQTRFHG